LQWIYSNTQIKNIKRADQILPEVHGTTLIEVIGWAGLTVQTKSMNSIGFIQILLY